jgi:hypothetical protein
MVVPDSKIPSQGTERPGEDPPPPPLAQDAIMPHMGQVFGLTEEAAVLVLIEMGLIKAQN